MLTHHFSEMGHGNTSCDPHLHPRLQTTNAREASAAGRLGPNAITGIVQYDGVST